MRLSAIATLISSASLLTFAATVSAQTATANLQPRSGSTVQGTVTLIQTDQGLQIDAQVENLTPNAEHGFHVHEGTDCDTPDASSAGPHFNPTDKPHGEPASSHSHAGDLPNLTANSDGRATLSTVSSAVSLNEEEKNSVIGRTMIVHALPDDHHSQPAGNAGARVACGVIVQNQP